MSRRALPALALLAALLAPTPAAAQESHFSAAVRLGGEGDFSGALAEARLETRQPDAAQATLHVWHHAGALEEALEAGLAGLEAIPTDPWLLDRCAYLAVSLGEGELALELCSRLRRSVDEETWQRSAWMLEEAELLAARDRAEARGLRRARWAVALFLAFSLGLSIWLVPTRGPAT